MKAASPCFGNLAPAGAIIKPAAASPHLIQHRGAIIFDSIEDFHTRIDDPALDVDANTVFGAARWPRDYQGCRKSRICHYRRNRSRRRPRHGAHLRRPDERHCIRNGGAACRPEAAVGGPLALVHANALTGPDGWFRRKRVGKRSRRLPANCSYQRSAPSDGSQTITESRFRARRPWDADILCDRPRNGGQAR
jgi:Dehydratase family